jgi:anti-anti-sigma factor
METVTYKFGEKIFLGNADALSIIIDKIFENEDTKKIIFDMQNVKLCDSYGLKLLIKYQRKANGTGKQLILYRPDPFLKEMLENIKLLQFFNISYEI